MCYHTTTKFTTKFSSDHYHNLAVNDRWIAKGKIVVKVHQNIGTNSMMLASKDSSFGTRLKFDRNGRIQTRKVEPRNIGTTAIVEDIFKDFPVRKIELQKNIKKEYAKLVNILFSYGISLRNNVRINATCIKNKSNESIMSVTGKKGTNGSSPLMNNVTEIFGPKQANTLVHLNPIQAGDFQVTGVISTCQHGKLNTICFCKKFGILKSNCIVLTYREREK